MDKANKKLVKQRAAKQAIVSLIRAIKKRDYMLLKGENVPEIEIIKVEIPEIMEHKESLIRLRA
jgi:hypothetical protein